MQMMKMGHSEEIDRILSEIEENDGDTIPISETFLFIPNNSIIGVQKSKVDHNIRVGKKSSLLGNYEIKGNAFIEDNSIMHGTLKSTGDVYCGKKTTIHGNISSGGDVKIEDKTKIAGDINAAKIFLAKNSVVDGELFAKNGISFHSSSKKDAQEKIQRFENETDIVDEVNDMLE